MDRNPQGFTLIELLLVVVIIAILAAGAIPRFAATRDQARFSAMQSDLRNLQNAQELLYNNGSIGKEGATPIPRYNYVTTGTITSSSSNPDLDFRSSKGVEITLAPAPGGYTARADHQATAAYCVVTVSDMSSTQSIVCSPGS